VSPAIGRPSSDWAVGGCPRSRRRSGVPEVRVLFAGVPVADIESAAAFYERIFGRPADVVSNPNEVMWRCSDPAWLYIVVDPKRAGHGLVALCVNDLQGTVAELERRGVDCGPIVAVGDAGRKAEALDPDGNTISLIEVASPGPPA
jgi:predicted enzyme related to lactoylglutathione lyase